MWAAIKRTPDFYNKLDWMNDGKQLWTYLTNSIDVDLDVKILTGVPRGFKEAEGQKRSWCKRELGDQFESKVICCPTKDKPKYATQGAILIDDRLNIADEWIANGGIFIHHTSSENTINELKRLLFIREEAEYEYIVVKSK
jgi:hypothetical protein